MNKLCFYRSVNWASVSTSAAVNALISVNYEDVAVGDCFNRTFRCACATSDASISNLKSHSKFLLIKIYLWIRQL